MSKMQPAKSESWSTVDLITKDIKCWLTQIEKWSLQHIPRGSNLVAHELAINALGLDHDVVDMENPTSCLFSDLETSNKISSVSLKKKKKLTIDYVSNVWGDQC